MPSSARWGRHLLLLLMLLMMMMMTMSEAPNDAIENCISPQSAVATRWIIVCALRCLMWAYAVAYQAIKYEHIGTLTLKGCSLQSDRTELDWTELSCSCATRTGNFVAVDTSMSVVNLSCLSTIVQQNAISLTATRVCCSTSTIVYNWHELHRYRQWRNYVWSALGQTF